MKIGYRIFVIYREKLNNLIYLSTKRTRKSRGAVEVGGGEGVGRDNDKKGFLQTKIHFENKNTVFVPRVL